MIISQRCPSTHVRRPRSDRDGSLPDNSRGANGTDSPKRVRRAPPTVKRTGRRYPSASAAQILSHSGKRKRDTRSSGPVPSPAILRLPILCPDPVHRAALLTRDGGTAPTLCRVMPAGLIDQQLGRRWAVTLSTDPIDFELFKRYQCQFRHKKRKTVCGNCGRGTVVPGIIGAAWSHRGREPEATPWPSTADPCRPVRSWPN